MLKWSEVFEKTGLSWSGYCSIVSGLYHRKPVRTLEEVSGVLSFQERYFTATQAAEYIGLSRSRFHVLFKSKNIPCHTFGSEKFYFLKKDIIDFKEKRIIPIDKKGEKI